MKKRISRRDAGAQRKYGRMSTKLTKPMVWTMAVMVFTVEPVLSAEAATTTNSSAPRDHYDPVFSEMNAIVRDPALGVDEKIAHLKTFGEKRKGYFSSVLWNMNQVNPERTFDVGLEWFHLPGSTTSQRLEIGKWLLTRPFSRDQWLADSGFSREYAMWLVKTAIEDKGDSLMAVRSGGETAVGQLAWWAAGYDGFSTASFPLDADRQVIPVLVRCLGAPDEIWPENQGDCIRGKPGSSTGRNYQRQCIPVALARLKAVDAIPNLERTLRNHHDLYLCMNSAFALGMLADEPRRRALEQELVECAKRGSVARFLKGNGIPGAKHSMFSFARGLLEQKDMAGIAYLGPEWFTEGSTLWTAADMIYWLDTRLAVTREIKDVRLVNFFQTGLSDPILAKVWRQDKKFMETDKHLATVWSNPESRKNWETYSSKTFRELLRQIKANNGVELAPEIKAIADSTASPDLAATAKETLKDWPPLKK
jgi:hypothetical protein